MQAPSRVRGLERTTCRQEGVSPSRTELGAAVENPRVPGEQGDGGGAPALAERRG